MTMNERASIFVSHKVSTHRKAAERIKTVLESRTERLDVYVCEDIPAGDRWQEWIEKSISNSQMLLVLWPLKEEGVDLTWMRDEISRFKVACPDGRLVVLKADQTRVPEIVRDFQCVDVCRDALAERLLEPLYSHAAFLKLTSPLNARVSAEDVQRDAAEIERAFRGLEETHAQPYRELLIVETSERGALDRAQVRAPHGCIRILNWNKRSFSWNELQARAAEEKTRGKFWISEMEAVIGDIELGNAPRVMSSTFRGRGETSGHIFQPQLEQVDFSEDLPIRYSFGFHEVLVPELVRGPGAIGDVFNLIHLAVRVRWEVLNPFFLNLGSPRSRKEISAEERNAVIAKVSGSLRTIDLEASRHNMLEAAALDAFQAEDRNRVKDMVREREAIKEAIASAVQKNDFDELMWNLASALEPNARATELLTEKFLELLRKDHERIAQLRSECLEGMVLRDISLTPRAL